MLKQVRHDGLGLVMLLSLTVLAACKPTQADDVQPQPESQADAAETTKAIPCALDGAQQFTDACQGELTPQKDRRLVIVRHPDGGFRRFEYVSDGRGIVTADGAAVAQVALQGGEVEVSVGNDRYRFPAKVRQDDAVR